MPAIPYLIAAGLGFGGGLLAGNAFDKAMKLIVVGGVAYVVYKQMN